MGHGTVSGLGRILGDLEMDNPSSVVTKNDHGIQQLKRHGRDHEHVNRGDGCHMVPQELRQVVEGALGRRGRCLPTSSLADVDAELEQFAVDARGAPERIGATHLTDQGPDFGARLGASGTA